MRFVMFLEDLNIKNNNFLEGLLTFLKSNVIHSRVCPLWCLPLDWRSIDICDVGILPSVTRQILLCFCCVGNERDENRVC